MTSQFLTPEEVKEFTDRSHKKLQIEALRAMGVAFWVTPAGRPKVARAVLEGRKGTSTAPKAPWVPPGLRSG